MARDLRLPPLPHIGQGVVEEANMGGVEQLDVRRRRVIGGRRHTCQNSKKRDTGLGYTAGP